MVHLKKDNTGPNTRLNLELTPNYVN